MRLEEEFLQVKNTKGNLTENLIVFYVFPWVSEGGPHTRLEHVKKSEDSLQKLVLPFHHVGSAD